jgi:glycosyltransferase involved in cell wall biosynthesis
VDLSVVVAATNAARSIGTCLETILRACTGLDAEVLVIDASTDGTASRIDRSNPMVRVVHLEPGRLAPELWAEGYRRSTGRVVAFTTGHCLAGPTWARSLIAAIDAGAAGAGGPFAIAAGARPLDWAVFFLRYSAFLPAQMGSGRISGEIAGDNAAYSRRALEPHAASFAGGFWEIDVHGRLRAAGGWLAAVPDAVVHFGRSFPAATIFAQRFAHGRHFGAARARGGTWARWRIVLAAPFVPFVLALRAARRVWPSGRDRARFAAALPWFLVLAAAWAAGEAWGALAGARG